MCNHSRYKASTAIIPRKTELKYRKLFSRAIFAQYQPIIRIAGEQGAESALQQIPLFVRPDPLIDVFTQMFREIAPRTAYEYRRSLQQGRKGEPGPYLTKADPDFDSWLNYFNEFILPSMLRRANIRITSVTQTTQRLLRDAINAGIEQGLGIDKIAGYLFDEMGSATASRARTIAQTETISASNQAAFEGANSAGIPYRKFWSNSGLESVRESHIFAQEWSYGQDGIEPEEYFDMGNGNFLLHPGDPEAPAEEVVNCRCTLITMPT